MKNENRAVFDRIPERTDFAFEFSAGAPALPFLKTLQPAQSETPPACRKTAATAFIRLLGWIADRLRRRRHRTALLELSDEQLKDIGISRCQVDSDDSRYRLSQSHALERRSF